MAVGGSLTAAAASADTLTVTQSATNPPRGNPETLVFASTAAATPGGGGPYLYAVVQPTGAGACQATYGSDLQVVGSQATKLTPNANQQVNTGSDSHAYNFTSYTPGADTVCSWLETDANDSSTENDTSSVVTATATSSFAVTNTDSLSVVFSTASPKAATPVTATFNSQASPIDASGDGPYLYTLLQPASAGACQATYGTDLKVDGSQAIGLAPTANQEVRTGADSHAYNYTSYSPGAYTVCGWLETDAKDSSTANDTPSVVTSTTSANLTISNSDTVSAALSTTTPIAGQPFTATVSGNDTPTSPNGATPFLYAVVQPTSVGGCGATYGADLQVARSQATVLVKGIAVNTPSFSNGYTVKKAAGSFQECSWLETDDADSLYENDTSSVVLASAGPLAITVAAAPVIVVPRLSASSLKGLALGKPQLSFSSVAGSGTLKSIKLTLPAGVASRSAALLTKYVVVSSGGKRVRHSVTRSGRTLTITFRANAKSVTVVVGSQALTETATLKKAIKAHHTTKLQVRFTLTNTGGGVKTTAPDLRV